MKKSFSVISMMLVLAGTLMGCATTGDLEKVQAHEDLINMKADQALQDAQAAKTAADAAALKAEEASTRTEDAIKKAEEREQLAADAIKKAEEQEQIAEEAIRQLAEAKAKMADEAFRKSMLK